MPMEPSSTSEHRRARARSRSPWAGHHGRVSASTVIGPTSHNYNSNQNTVTGSAHIVNSNTNINVPSGFNVIFHHHPANKSAAPSSEVDELASVFDLFIFNLHSIPLI